MTKALLYSHILKQSFKKSLVIQYSIVHVILSSRWKKMKTKQLCVPFNYKLIHLETESNLHSLSMCLPLFSPSPLSHLSVRGEYSAIFCFDSFSEASLITSVRHRKKFLSRIQIGSGFWQPYVFRKREICTKLACLEHSFCLGEGNEEAQYGIMRIPTAFWATCLCIIFCTQFINLPLHKL